MSDPASTPLSPAHAALVEAARLRDDRRLVPPGRVRGGARRRLADKLVALGLARAVPSEDAAWWVDPDRGPIGLRLAADTDGGADGGATDGGGADEPPVGGRTDADAPASRPTEPRASTKIAGVLALLRRPEGADLAAIVAATGWLPHTARAALTGLRRRGYALDARKFDGRTVYGTAPAAGVEPVEDVASASDPGEDAPPPPTAAR